MRARPERNGAIRYTVLEDLAVPDGSLAIHSSGRLA